MNRIIFLLIIFVLSDFLVVRAQDNSSSSSHLTFKGVPIDGTLDEYVLKMKKAGFTHIGTKDGVAMLKGDFAGYKNCIVGVSTLKQKDLVSKVVVIFSESETWSSLSTNYFSLKEMLTEKYGKPSDCVEEFKSSIQPKEDNSKMHEVKFDNCNYVTTYKTNKGSIKLSIEHDGVIRCFVTLGYLDRVNGVEVKKEALKDL